MHSKIAELLLESMKLSKDKRLASFCAESLVAAELEGRGFEVEVRSKSQKGPDLRIAPPYGPLAEVKSSHLDLESFSCCVSFGNGKSLKERIFQYCVFVAFEALEPSI